MCININILLYLVSFSCVKVIKMSIKGDSSDWVLPWRLEPLGLASAVTGLRNCPGSSK